MRAENTLPDTPEAAEQLLQWIGAIDGSGGVDYFRVTVEGRLANCIMSAIHNNPEWASQFDQKPVKVFRSAGLEISCNGFYTEGRGCRAIVHRAVAQYKKIFAQSVDCGARNREK